MWSTHGDVRPATRSPGAGFGCRSDPRLYHDQVIITLTPIERTAQARSTRPASCGRRWAATCRAAFAAVSHLPHMLAFALMNSLASQPEGDKYLKLAGPFAISSRIAAVGEDVAMLIANREELGVRCSTGAGPVGAGQADRGRPRGRTGAPTGQPRANWRRLRPGAPAWRRRCRAIHHSPALAACSSRALLLASGGCRSRSSFSGRCSSPDWLACPAPTGPAMRAPTGAGQACR